MTIVAVVVVIAGIGYSVGATSSGQRVNGGRVPPADTTALDRASTASVGVTARTISVGFPIANLAPDRNFE
jgi:hypothetical protein